jgi:hypothetical protein
MWPSRWQPLPVLICSAGNAGGADALGVVGGLLVAFDDADGQLVLEQFDGLAEQRGLAGTGAGNEVQREDAALVEPLAVGRGIGVVLGQDVLLDLHHARLAHAGHVGAGRAGAVVEIAGDAVFVMVMLFAMRVGVLAFVRVGVAVLAAVAVVMGMRMHAERRVVVAVIVLIRMVVGMGMHRAVFMDMGVFVRPAFDLRFTCAAAANRTHSRLLIIRFLFP